jgi:uncharacterized protein (DUF2141 family)
MSIPRIVPYAAAVLFIAPVVFAEEPDAFRIELFNVAPGKGQILVAVCREREFLGSTCAFKLTTPATENPQVVRIPKSALSAGRYAVQVIYDLNSNGKLDSNLLRIPQEPVGFSRDAKGRMGPPSFEQAAVDFDGAPRQLSIHLYCVINCRSPPS